MTRLIIRGGRVVDPASGRDEVADVEIADGKIATIGPNLPASGHQIFEAAGALVTPGLVDIHTHCYWAGTLLGVNADKIGPRTGVTTWVDCGSAGAATFEGFYYHVIKRSRLRILPLLNLSYVGLAPAGNLTLSVGELDDFRFADLREIHRVGERFKGEIVGIKLRASNNAVAANGPVVLPLAREAADMLGLPLMVHIGMPPPTIEDVLPFLRAGDILTHIYNPNPGGNVLDAQGRLRTAVKEALARGVRMEVGHGGASFSFEVAERAMAEGLLPSAIGTDLHGHNIEGPVFDLPHVMAKFLALGMSLNDVLRLTTCAPADIIGRPDLGRLQAGGEADVAVFRMKESAVQLRDSLGAGREGTLQLENMLTVCRGEIVETFDDGREEGRRY